VHAADDPKMSMYCIVLAASDTTTARQ